MAEQPSFMPLIKYYRSRFGQETPRAQAQKAYECGLLITVRVGKLIFVNVRATDAKLNILRPVTA